MIRSAHCFCCKRIAECVLKTPSLTRSNWVYDSDICKQVERKNRKPELGRCDRLVECALDVKVLIKLGWRPGAISKRLLRKLNDAKQSKGIVEEIKQMKRTKKRFELKATLIISNMNGEHSIEMQVMPDCNSVPPERYSQLVYRIAKENNDDRNKKKDRIKRRLVRRAAKGVCDDEACNNICLEAYNHAVGLPSCYSSEPTKLPIQATSQDEILDSYSCSNNDVSSNCTSSEVDWEIQFSPPKFDTK